MNGLPVAVSGARSATPSFEFPMHRWIHHQTHPRTKHRPAKHLAANDGSADDKSANAWDQAIQTGTSVVAPVVDADTAMDAQGAETANTDGSFPAAADAGGTSSNDSAANENSDNNADENGNRNPDENRNPVESNLNQPSAVASIAAAIAASRPVMSSNAEDSDFEDENDEEDAEEVLVRSKKPEEEMDMTPMVDVTFLLLIFFMVTAAFSLQKSIEMPRQQTEAPSTTNEEPEEDVEMVDVEVDENGSFLVLTNDWERETPGKQNLIAALREASAGKNEPMKLNVKVHEAAKVKAMVDAMDAGTIADYSPILITQVDGFD